MRIENVYGETEGNADCQDSCGKIFSVFIPLKLLLFYSVIFSLLTYSLQR